MRCPDPWSVLRSRPDLTLVWAGDLPAHWRGCTDGHSTIWIRTGLSQTERRCVIAHELVHIRHHHAGHQPACVERQVRAETARWLIPDLHLIRDALCMPDPAAELWVTPAVLRDRLAGLTDRERSRIQASLDPAN